MQTPSSHLRGILLMVVATACFTINDTVLKAAMADLPPFQAVFLRSVSVTVLGVPLLLLTGYRSKVKLIFDRHVATRNFLELIAVFGFVLGLAYAPIADLTAISQLSPMLVLLGAAWFFGEQLGRLQLVLVVVALVGAVLVAQPGGSGFSAFALLGFWNAGCSAIRDLLGRRIGAAVPGLVVAIGAGVLAMLGTGVATLLFEEWRTPSLLALGLIVLSSAFLVLGHWLLFSAYRAAPVGIVVPFCYMSTIWALISGVLVFGTWPNGLAIAGIDRKSVV